MELITKILKQFNHVSLVIGLFCCANITLGNNLKWSQKILQKIYETSGYPKIDQPKIKLLSTKKYGAYFEPAENIIFIESELLKICRAFGKDSSNALAFVIGHELAHAIYKHVHTGIAPTSFLQYADKYDSHEREEQTADIQGVFMSYLAGFRPESILSQILDKIYFTYKITDSINDQYPSLKTRKNSIKEVLKQVDILTNLFDACNILIMQEEYGLAKTGLEYIIQYYQGPEIFNNLGVVHLHLAQFYFDPTIDVYAYPFEVDLNTPLKKIYKPRGDLSTEDRILRSNYLEMAKKNFNQALVLNPQYSPAITNLACLLILNNQTDKATEFIQSQLNNSFSLENKAEVNYKFQNLAGIAHSIQKDKRSHVYFVNALKSKESLTRSFAKYNLNMLSNHSRSAKVKPHNQNPDFEKSMKLRPKFLQTDRLELTNVALESTKFPLKFSFKISGDESFYLFNRSGADLLAIKRKKINGTNQITLNPDQLPVSPVPGKYNNQRGGSIISLVQNKSLYAFDKKNSLIEAISIACY